MSVFSGLQEISRPRTRIGLNLSLSQANREDRSDEMEAFCFSSHELTSHFVSRITSLIEISKLAHVNETFILAQLVAASIDTVMMATTAPRLTEIQNTLSLVCPSPTTAPVSVGWLFRMCYMAISCGYSRVSGGKDLLCWSSGRRAHHLCPSVIPARASRVGL